MWETQLGKIGHAIEAHLDSLGTNSASLSGLEAIPYNPADVFKRYAASKERIASAQQGEEIRFIALTARNIVCPVLRGGERNPFWEALRKGVKFRGIVVDPKSEQSSLRAEIETPDKKEMKDRLIFKDSEIVRNWLNKDYKTFGISSHDRSNLQLRYSKYPLTFSLWLFNEFAFLEPYHYGKYENVPHLCGFGLLKMDNCTHEYETVRRHFEVLWVKCRQLY
jgi:hypothetical protein